MLDEIQACEAALNSLKYFCENAPEYHVVAAGSLLGVAVKRKKMAHQHILGVRVVSLGIKSNLPQWNRIAILKRDLLR